MSEDYEPPNDGVRQTTWIELSKLAQQAFFSRRRVEFRTLFGILTAVGLATWMGVTHANKLVTLLPGDLGFLYFVLWGLLLFYWQLPIRRGFEDDKNWKHYFMARAAKLKPPVTIEVLRDGADKFVGLTEERHRAWTISQMGVTAVFFAISWWAIQGAIATAKLHPERWNEQVGSTSPDETKGSVKGPVKQSPQSPSSVKETPAR